MLSNRSLQDRGAVFQCAQLYQIFQTSQIFHIFEIFQIMQTHGPYFDGPPLVAQDIGQRQHKKGPSGLKRFASSELFEWLVESYERFEGLKEYQTVNFGFFWFSQQTPPTWLSLRNSIYNGGEPFTQDRREGLLDFLSIISHSNLSIHSNFANLRGTSLSPSSPQGLPLMARTSVRESQPDPSRFDWLKKIWKIWKMSVNGEIVF